MTAPKPPITLQATSRALVLVALTITVLLWASAFVAIQVALPAFGYASLVSARLGLGALTFVVLASIVGVRRPSRSELPLLAALGALGYTGYQLLLSAGEETVPAGTAALLFAGAPVLTALLSHRLLGERLGARGWYGLAVAVVGAGTVAIAQGAEAGGALTGPGLVLGAAGCVALWITLQKRALATMRIFDVAAWSTWFGAAFAVPFASHTAGAFANAPVSALVSVLLLGIVATTVPFLLWAWVLARLEASQASTAMLLVGPAAVGISWLLLGEAPAPIALTGGAITLAGVATVVLRPRQDAAGDGRRETPRRPVSHRPFVAEAVR